MYGYSIVSSSRKIRVVALSVPFKHGANTAMTAMTIKESCILGYPTEGLSTITAVYSDWSYLIPISCWFKKKKTSSREILPFDPILSS